MQKPNFISFADWQIIKNYKHLNKTIAKIKKGYPIQYLIGYVDFYNLKINVNKNVLIPRFETEELIDLTLKIIKKDFKKTLKILDIGTGSGAIAIALKKELPASFVTSIDISSKALKVAKKNAKINNQDITFQKHNLKKNINTKFDIIISNPPYLSSSDKIEAKVLKYEPKKALFANNDGLEFYIDIVKQAKRNLNKKGLLALEINPRLKSKIIKLLKKNFPQGKIILVSDLYKKERFVFLEVESE